jgi:Cu+-exporting ATPase
VRQGGRWSSSFDRQASGDCTSRVIFGDFAVSAPLPAFGRTTVRLQPGKAGSFAFACGMNMIHGTLMVDPSDPSEPSDQRTAQTPSRVPRAERPQAPAGPAPAEAEAERRAGAAQHHHVDPRR